MTSQKQTATAPHGHNDATQTLLDAFPDEAALIRADGTIIAINDAAAHRNGKRPEEVTGGTLFDLYPHDLAKEIKARIDEVVRSGAPIRFQEERDEIRAEHTLYPVFDSEGQVHQVAIVSCDITATYRAQTERDRLQNHVNAQKKMMDALIAALPDYVWIYDKNMRFVYASREGAKMLGLTAGRMVGRTWRELGLPPDVMEPFEADVHYVFGTEQTARKEMAFPTIKGERIYEYTLTPIHNGRDKVEQVLSVARDITERKQMEATVRQERDTALRYLDVAGVIIVALDADGRVTLLNQLGCEVLECSTDEVLGVYWFDTFVPSSDREEAKATFRRLLAAEEELAQYYENPIITKSGKERLIAWHNAVVRDDEGRIVGTLSSGTDVTEQREMETKISESEHKYRELVEGANSIILELDIDGRITFINTFGKQFFGYTDEELIGRHVVGTIVPETETSGRDLATMIDGVLADPDRYQDNVNENITKDGRRVWVSWTNRAIRTARGEVVGNRAIGNDITDLKRAEEKAESVAKFPEENPNPVLRLNSEGRILYANEASQKLLSDWDDTKEKDDAAPQLLRDVTAEALSSQARTTIEVSVRSHVYKFFVAPIIDVGYVNFYGRDITKRKWAENEAKRQARRADRSQCHHRGGQSRHRPPTIPQSAARRDHRRHGHARRHRYPPR